MTAPTREDRARLRYDAVPAYYMENVVQAAAWAERALTNHEGSGHIIEVSAAGTKHPGMVVCHFAKPSWAGDHSGSPRETASEAIVASVCEYLAGM